MDASDPVCANCGQAIFQTAADRAAGRWNTVYRNSVDTYQCPRVDEGIVVNDGHEPVEAVAP